MRTSFIPKRVLDRPERPHIRPTGLLFVISLVLLFISVSLWAGSFFYDKLLNNQVNALSASVGKERKNLDQSTIVLFQRLDNKLRVASDVLKNHVTILPIFQALEDLTLPTVRYTNFSFTPKSVELSGVATSYEDIAVQTQVLSKDKNRIQSFIFSNLNLDANGNVTFKLTVVPEPGLTSYTNTLTS